MEYMDLIFALFRGHNTGNILHNYNDVYGLRHQNDIYVKINLE